jgi:hypothetical protein
MDKIDLRKKSVENKKKKKITQSKDFNKKKALFNSKNSSNIKSHEKSWKSGRIF